MRENVKNNWRWTPPLLLVLLPACATPLPASVPTCPTLPTMPSATQPTPRLPYSASARLKLEAWQQRLTDTPATQPSASQPGRSK